MLFQFFYPFLATHFSWCPLPPFSFTFRHFPFCLSICAVESVVARECSKQPENAAYFLQLSTAYHFLRLFWYESTVQINSRPLSILRVCRIFFSIKPLDIWTQRKKIMCLLFFPFDGKTISNLCTHSRRNEQFKNEPMDSTRWMERWFFQ